MRGYSSSAACKAWRTLPSSEDADRRLLDVGPQQGMQSIARGHVDIDAELVLQILLDAYQVKRIESAAAIVVDEEIEITCRLWLVARDRAEQVKRGRPERLDCLGVTLELRDRFYLIHGRHFIRLCGKRHAPWRGGCAGRG